MLHPSERRHCLSDIAVMQANQRRPMSHTTQVLRLNDRPLIGSTAYLLQRDMLEVSMVRTNEWPRADAD
jgi:hypothetical protein